MTRDMLQFGVSLIIMLFVSSRLLLLKGNVLCAKGDAAVAIQPLVDAVNMSHQCFLSLTAAIAILHLAFVQVTNWLMISFAKYCGYFLFDWVKIAFGICMIMGS